MKLSHFFLLFIGLLLVIGCKRTTDAVLEPESGSSIIDAPTADGVDTDDQCDTSEQVKSFFIHTDTATWLKGGEADSQHFDVSNWDMNPCGLRFGFCREHFPAVYQPRYHSLDEAMELYDPEDPFILVEDKQVKAYSIDLLVKHEAVNDTINGHPILVAYCTLADLPIVYTRNYCDHTLTFALSGYTYHEDHIWDGTDAFVMWDRETESLWWPLGDKAVSGVLGGQALATFQSHKWRVTDWGSIQSQYPEVKVLANDILVETPRGWPTVPASQVNCF